MEVRLGGACGSITYSGIKLKCCSNAHKIELKHQATIKDILKKNVRATGPNFIFQFLARPSILNKIEDGAGL